MTAPDLFADAELEATLKDEIRRAQKLIGFQRDKILQTQHQRDALGLVLLDLCKSESTSYCETAKCAKCPVMRALTRAGIWSIEDKKKHDNEVMQKAKE